VEEHLSFMKRSKASSGKSNINVVSEALVKFLGKEGERKGISFVKVLDGSLPDIAIEESYLRQALLNVIRNSFDAMPSGGTIKIISRRLKGEAELEIEDTGIGISKENLKRVSDPFFTTKDVGTGLGLYIARDIVLTAEGGYPARAGKARALR
jgi:signal transduction histidine kinase